ncbi:MerC domain-containing protein [Ochrovirga pacifica]|uniref:MerC domain-containing protein n=1 Tax=Ochrovirga pacifica TaxID=1042376 RepID=UPI0002559B3E|nr:MerC family mercury resistance protein [Ochrovirga pacifica]
MVIKLIGKRSDLIGALVSGLCLVHCLATPLLFLAKTCSDSHCIGAPNWWKFFDSIFLVLSFIAVFWSSKNSSKNWMQLSLWFSWSTLAFVVLNEKFHWFALAEFYIYFPTLALVFLHIYNRKYCQCDTGCCAHTS